MEKAQLAAAEKPLRYGKTIRMGLKEHRANLALHKSWKSFSSFFHFPQKRRKMRRGRRTGKISWGQVFICLWQVPL
jgi:hypothetical protein